MFPEHSLECQAFSPISMKEMGFFKCHIRGQNKGQGVSRVHIPIVNVEISLIRLVTTSLATGNDSRVLFLYIA